MSIIATFLFALAYAAPSLQQQFSGTASMYSPYIGFCGEANTPNDLVASLSSGITENFWSVCGRYIKVTGMDGRSVTARVVDICPSNECGTHDIDLSHAAFSQVGDMAAGRQQVIWEWA